MGYYPRMDLNIYSQMQIEAELERLLNENKQLKLEQEHILEKVKLLIAKVSHEFKTPLNSILGFTELISHSSDDAKIKEYTNIILTSSEHMLELIQNIIDVIRAKYKPIELSYSIFDAKEIIEEIIKTFKSNEIKYTLIDKMICADYMRFKQLIYNLISNAVKFNNSECKKIQIITYMENSNFCFEIADNGDGIDKENIDKIFDFFEQSTNEQVKRNLGYGIGLSLCKTIVDAHKGNITVTSNLGEGSTFIFKIPAEIN